MLENWQICAAAQAQGRPDTLVLCDVLPKPPGLSCVSRGHGGRAASCSCPPPLRHLHAGGLTTKPSIFPGVSIRLAQRHSSRCASRAACPTHRHHAVATAACHRRARRCVLCKVGPWLTPTNRAKLRVMRVCVLRNWPSYHLVHGRVPHAESEFSNCAERQGTHCPTPPRTSAGCMT